MLIEQIQSVIHHTPARQNQVCYRVNIDSRATGGIRCRFTPTIDHFDQSRTAFTDPDLLYSSALFHTGLAVGVLEHWLQAEGHKYTVTRQISDRAVNIFPGCVSAIQQNSAWIKEAVVSWIDQQVREGREPFQGYEYDRAKCHRDLEFLLQAFQGDLAHASNEKTAFISSTFRDRNNQPVTRVAQESVIHRWIKTLLLDSVLTGTRYEGLATYGCQQLPEIAVEPAGRAWLEFVYSHFIIVLEQGLEHQHTVIRARWPEDYIEVAIDV